MNEAGANPTLTGLHVWELRVLIEQRSGILFDASRQQFLVTRTVEHMQRRRLSHGGELLRLIKASSIEYDEMLERLLTQETSFLRYPALFSAFTQQVVPELMGRRIADAEPGLRIWSAGCATGEEPYSIAMCLCDAAGVGAAPQASVFATDVSREALRRARRGMYAPRALENVSASQMAFYFDRKGPESSVKPMLRQMVKFAPMNLAQPVYLGRFDCIFCMNVLIYFGAELRRKLLETFFQWLEPGGYLFLGHAESAADAPMKFQQQFVNGARLLQKPMHQRAGLARAAERTR